MASDIKVKGKGVLKKKCGKNIVKKEAKLFFRIILDNAVGW